MASKEDTKVETKRKRTIKKEMPSPVGSGDSKRVKPETPTKKDTKGNSLFYAEENEVDNRNPQEDLHLFTSTCDELRCLMSEVKSLKAKDGDKSAEIEERKAQTCVAFTTLKKLNRLAQFRCKKVRDVTNEAKQRIDQFHLQLQNLLYETMHLEKEITKCLEFKSRDEEIELVPVEQFYDEAPAEISRKELTEEDKHQLTLARLEWELEQRKRLDAQMKDAQDNKEKLEQEIKTKQEYLENLQPKLKSILESTKPVQEYLGMPFDEIREQHQTACHLPHPLYVLYMQLCAYQQACDKKMKVKIEGDLDAAKNLNAVVPDIEEESDSDQEDSEKKSKRRRKTVDGKNAEHKEKILKQHPLTIVLELTCGQGSGLKLRFHYLLSLHILTVHVYLTHVDEGGVTPISGGDLLLSDTVLDELYSSDYGKASPNPANQYELQKLGVRDFSSHIQGLGKPYLWAQWLGGLQFLDQESPVKAQSAISSAHMQHTIKLLRQRIRSRGSLFKQLSSLEKGSVYVSKEYQHLFPTKVVSHLSSWKRSTYEDFSVLRYTSKAVEMELVGENDMYFTAVLDRGSAKLTAQIAVAANYPEVAPVFILCLNWMSEKTAANDINVQALEEEVNIHYEELAVSGSRDELLTNQIQRLLVCFDVYLETESEKSESEGPAEISREKVFIRYARGPNRMKPYKYCPELGVFTQR